MSEIAKMALTCNKSILNLKKYFKFQIINQTYNVKESHGIPCEEQGKRRLKPILVLSKINYVFGQPSNKKLDWMLHVNPKHLLCDIKPKRFFCI